MRRGQSMIADQRGSAMVETALLCFFIYGPILMMVLILGDVTLERQQAQVAAAYMAWTPEEISSETIRSRFFPDSDAEAATGTVYQVTRANDETADAPEYVVGAPTGDDDKNIWTKLQLMATGEWWSRMEWQLVDGVPQLVPVVHRTTDSDGRWLVANEIVPAVELPTEFAGLEEGQNIDFNWGSATERAVAATALLNHEFSGSGPTPLRESQVRLDLWHTSVFFDELDTYRHGDRQYSFDLPRGEEGRVGLKLRFDSTNEDGEPSTQIGKTWLFNPDCRPEGDTRTRFYELMPTLFSYQMDSGVYLTLADMLRPTSTTGGAPSDQRPFRFVQPGDPRYQ